MSGWYAWLNMGVGLLVIVNPLLGISALTSLSGHDNAASRRSTAGMAAVTVGVVLTISALAGQAVLSFFGIGIPQFQVGGGILILLMAVAMLNAKMSGARHTEEEADEALERDNVGVVPLGIPLLAGPGAISTAIIYANQANDWLDLAVLVGEIWLLALLTWGTLLAGEVLIKVLGKIGVNIATRIMGLILAALAIGFITQGLKTLLPGLA